MKLVLDLGVLAVTLLLMMTMGMIFAVRNVALASAIAITLLNRVDYAVFAPVYFLVEVPLLLGTVTIYRRLPA